MNSNYSAAYLGAPIPYFNDDIIIRLDSILDTQWALPECILQSTFVVSNKGGPARLPGGYYVSRFMVLCCVEKANHG